MIFTCPHCDGSIIIEPHEYNCKIIRHGILKSTGVQINPHLNKIQCDMLRSTNQIHGCGKPSRITNVNNELVLTVCGYV